MKTMKINKKEASKIILLGVFVFSTTILAACGNTNNPQNQYKDLVQKETEKQEALNNWAKSVLDNGTFDERIEVLTEYSNLNDFTNELAFELSASLREDIQAELDKGNLESAYEMSVKLFSGMALQANIDMLAQNARAYAQTSFENKEYQKSMDAAAKILQLYWDEDAMDMKLTAEYELLKQAVESSDLEQGQKYYDDIMDITGLKGNEKLAEKHRANAKQYSDKFPDSKFNE